MAMGFDYATAFSRNIGWLTEEEQQRLRHKRVAIAGMGGVGGFHLTTLARLGIAASTSPTSTRSSWPISTGRRAPYSTLGRPKVDTLADMARDINPECDIEVFPDGVQPENLDSFFEGVDLYVDGLDAFAFGAARDGVRPLCGARDSSHECRAARHERGAHELPARSDDVRAVLPANRMLGC